MDPTVNFITVATLDLDVPRRFYGEALGWTALMDVADEVVFYPVGHGLVLGFYAAGKFAADLQRDEDVNFGGFTLAHNVATDEQVDAVLAQASAAGASVLAAARPAPYGGRYGHFADPMGVQWEVAHNPGWRVEPDGRVVLAPPK